MDWIIDFLRESRPPFEPVLLGHDDQGKPIELTFDHFYRHMHLLGLSRRGKSRAIEGILRQFLTNGTGFTLIDPDGEIYEPLVAWLAAQGESFLNGQKVHLFNPSDPEFAPSFNPLRVRPGELIEDRVNCFMDAVAQVNRGEPLAIMQLYQMIFRAVMNPLASKGLTPLEALLALPKDEEGMRAFLMRDLSNWVDEQTWKEIGSWNDRQYQENIGSFMRRMVNILHHPTIQRIFGQTHNNLDVLEVMDRGQVLLVNFKGVNPQVAGLLGRALVNDFVHTASSMRVPGEARPHIMVIDECASFLSEDIVFGLDRTSKFGLHLVLSHQRIEQLREVSENICDGVMAGAQTKIVFGTSYKTTKEIVDEILAAYYNTERIKENVKIPMLVGHQLVTRRGGSTSEAHLEGYTTATGTGSSSGESDSTSDTEGESSGRSASTGSSFGSGAVYGHGDPLLWGGPFMTDQVNRSEVTSEQSGEADSYATSRQRAYASARSYAESRFDSEAKQEAFTRASSETWHEVQEGIIEERATQTYSLEEERHRHMVQLQGLEVQRFILKEPIGQRVRLGTTQTVERVTIEPEVVWAFTRHLLATSGINTLKHVVDERSNKRRLELRRAVGPQVMPPPKRPNQARVERRDADVEEAEEIEQDEDDPRSWLGGWR